jgi:peptide/nickel transport system ATP-binding protein
VLQLPRPTSGSVRFDGSELTRLDDRAMRAMRPKMSLVLQDPISALNPRRTITEIVAEPLRIAGETDGLRHRVNEMLETVSLDTDAADRRPLQLSGGQCQRVNIARALIRNPKLLVCDEPVSALDVSVQAQILNLLEELKSRYGLTMLFISHDLSVVKNISDRVAVMYLGKLCELAPAEDLYRAPAHPYTVALLASIPTLDTDRDQTVPPLAGELPSPVDPPSGCRFRTRCPRATEQCVHEVPVMRAHAPGHYVACHNPV